MRKLILGTAFALAALTGPAYAQSIPESSDPIKLAIHDWTGQHITTRIAGEILKKMGYTVDYVVAGYIPMFDAVANGEIDASLEIWQFSSKEYYQRALDTGNVELLGETGIEPHEGLVYPAYMEEKCPGLPDWKALKDCAEAFAATETFPQGRVVDFPADWGPRTSKVIAAFGLDKSYKVIPSGSEGNIIAEIRSAVARKEGVLAMMWTPHWIWADKSIDLKWVSLPPYSEGCDENPAVGLSPDVTHDCDWGPAWVRKIGWSGMKEKWPAAHQFLSKYQIDNETQIELLKAIDLDGGKIDDVVSSWVDANEAKWRIWVEQAQAAASQ